MSLGYTGFVLASGRDGIKTENFGTDIAHILAQIHRAFDHSILERLEVFKIATENKRRLTGQEQENYAKNAKAKFDDFLNFVGVAGAKYDFLVDTINGDFKKETPVVAKARGRFTRLLGGIVRGRR